MVKRKREGERRVEGGGGKGEAGWTLPSALCYQDGVIELSSAERQGTVGKEDLPCRVKTKLAGMRSDRGGGNVVATLSCFFGSQCWIMARASSDGRGWSLADTAARMVMGPPKGRCANGMGEGGEKKGRRRAGGGRAGERREREMVPVRQTNEKQTRQRPGEDRRSSVGFAVASSWCHGQGGGKEMPRDREAFERARNKAGKAAKRSRSRSRSWAVQVQVQVQSSSGVRARASGRGLGRRAVIGRRGLVGCCDASGLGRTK